MSAWTETGQPTGLRRTGSDLAHFLTGLTFDDLPDEVSHQAHRVLLEGISWIFLGGRRPEGRRLHRLLDGAPPGSCSLVGHPRTSTASWSAFAHGALSQVQDCNDGQRVASVFGGAYHPGRVIVPVALAMSEKTATSGRALLTALAAGYEVASRIRGPEPRPPAEAYAGAAVAAKLAGLDVDAMIDAMGLAGHLASPIPDETPYDVTFLTVGNIARLSVEAADMANHGLTGPPLRDDARLSARLEGDGLGETFGIMDIYMKPYLGCRLLHGAVDAALEYRAERDWREIEHIRVRVIPEAHYVAGHVRPDSYYRTCQLSLPYCLAATLVDGELGEDQFTAERIGSADVLELHDRVEVVTDESLDAGYPHHGRPSVMEITTSNGRHLRWEGRYDKGEPENALTDEELVDKFRRWAGLSLDPVSADRLIHEVFCLSESDDPTPIFEILRSARPGGRSSPRRHAAGSSGSGATRSPTTP